MPATSFNQNTLSSNIPFQPLQSSYDVRRRLWRELGRTRLSHETAWMGRPCQWRRFYSFHKLALLVLIRLYTVKYNEMLVRLIILNCNRDSPCVWFRFLCSWPHLGARLGDQAHARSKAVPEVLDSSRRIVSSCLHIQGMITCTHALYKLLNNRKLLVLLQ